MARGKYAVKAAGQRATAAAETVEALKAQLANARKTHAAEVAGLKTEVQQLAGKLTREVNSLAAAEVARVRSEARALVESEREARRAKAIEAWKFLLSLDLRIGYENAARVCELLGIDLGESVEQYGGVPRAARRLTNGRARAAMSRLEQAIVTGAPEAANRVRTK